LTNKFTFAMYKKRASIPQNVLILIDLPELVTSNDDRFGALNDLCLSSSSRPLPRAGRPHSGKKKANALFTDGSVRLIKGFLPVPDTNVAPTALVPGMTDLADWMIKSSDYAKGPQTSAGTVNYPNPPTPGVNIWKKGLPLPFDTMAN